MEDPNTLAADCIVICCCCCCQCLILQILILILLRLPRKLVRKTKEYTKRKLRRSKRGENITKRVEQHQEPDEFFIIHEESREIQANAADICGGNCLQEVEVIMEKVSQDGEFGFGSFRGQMESRSFPSIASYCQNYDSKLCKVQNEGNGANN